MSDPDVDAATAGPEAAGADSGVARIEERSSDEERLEVEAELLVQSDNRGRDDEAGQEPGAES